MMGKKGEYYVNPKDFGQQVKDYYKSGIMCPEIGTAIYNIATRLSYRPNFVNYTFKEEMIGDAILNMVKALQAQKFDPDRGNAFSYFGKIAWHAFIEKIKKENKRHTTLVNYQEQVYNEYISLGYIPDDQHQNHDHHEGD
jgi:DNA-directed RNA polymerase specialized sigma24 family protein